jgi:hypothetical protein
VPHEDGWGERTGNELPPVVGAFAEGTRKMTLLELRPGYTGALEFRSRAGGRFGDHRYSMQLTSSILRDGVPFLIDWEDPEKRDEAVTELFDGAVATFAPELPPEEGNCRTSRRCLVVIPFEGEPIVGFRVVRFWARMSLDSKPDWFYMMPVRPGVGLPPQPRARFAGSAAIEL